MKTITVDGKELKVWETDKLLIFSKNGEAVPDAEAEKYAYSFLLRDNIHISTDNVLMAARALLREGKIPMFSVLVIDKDGNTFQSFLDKDARMDDWHKDLCRIDDWLGRLM